MCVSLLRCLPTQRDLDPAAEVERQRGKSRSRIVMLARQVFDGGINLKITVEPVAAAHIDFLISRGQVAVGKQHGRAERGVEEESAAVPAANKVAAHRQRQLAPGITEIKTSGMRRAVERPVPYER